MVKARDIAHLLEDGSIDQEAWLKFIEPHFASTDMHLIRNACVLGRLAEEDNTGFAIGSCLQQGLAMADILFHLELDAEALACAIIYECVQYAELTTEDVEEHLGNRVASLLNEVEKMDAIKALHKDSAFGTQKHNQIDNLRRMMLAMVKDVRVVLIKMAERLYILRTANVLNETARVHIAQETFDIYAPLANRLGIGQIKWELEDLAFRYLEPKIYKNIAKSMNMRRVDRERYVKSFMETLNQHITQIGVRNFEVTGRVKHIFSTHKKMQRKNLPFEQIYDVIAVRVLTETVEDSYAVLGIVHSLWTQIPEEFDDYIADPKPNGYRSLHTAVVGPDQRNVEVQIRTHKMHEEAELGVAAHWMYKEGKPQKAGYENKIAWLRQVMDWQKELAAKGEAFDPEDLDTFEDRTYVFTPEGDIVDLPKDSTPLDFAYNIHSEVGHRCRGAKVNGNIVPLTYRLKTGEQIEIITSSKATPSRDWLNPHLGYIKSSRTKAKIHHWFKKQDYDKNLSEGHSLLEKEAKRLAVEVSNDDLKAVAKKYNYKTGQDILAALGSGDLRLQQVINALPAQPSQETSTQRVEPTIETTRPQHRYDTDDIHVRGMGRLLSYMAKCCKPLPGDAIIGFITQGRGISVHRTDCKNMLEAQSTKPSRLIDVGWGKKHTTAYPVDLILEAYDRHGLVRDITALLSNESANIIGLHTDINKSENQLRLQLSVEVADLNMMSRLMDKLKQIPNVVDVRREGR